MSLLDDLNNKKKRLKPTDTRITTPDGFQYTESSARVYQHTNQSCSGRPANLILRPPSCSGYVVDKKPDLHIGEVTENLLIGSVDTAMDESLLQSRGVTHILTVAPLPNYRPPLPHIRHLSLDILDLPETELALYFETAFPFLDDAVAVGGKALVHCNAGVSRSAAITLAYLMRTRKLSYDEAWTLLKTRRPSVNPNIGFIIQLKNYEKQLSL